MKQTVKTSRTAGYLEKIFRAVNEKYFEGKLEEPIITIQSTPRAYGHVTVSKAWHKGEEQRHELNIAAGTLDRPIENVVATLIHECVHLWCMQEGIKDTSRGNTYHNKHFRDEAVKRDLKIDYDQRIGWSVTSPTPELCDFIIEQGWGDIEMGRNDFGFFGKTPGGSSGNAGGIQPPPKKPSSSRKYCCPKCGISVRATKEVRISCMDCDIQMEIQL